jgi:ABC-2 type transport system permease protein
MSSVRREFTKTLFQKRTYIGWAGLFIIPFLVMLAFRFSDGGPHGQGAQSADVGALIMTQVKSNGIFLIVAALMVMATFFLPLLAAMAGSYTISGEAENGTLRTMLMQPVRRLTLLLSKWFVANIYMAICLLILGVASLIAGGAVFGLKAAPLFTGQVVGVWHALGLAAASYAFVFVGMVCAVSLAVLFSTFTNSSLTAVAVALVLVIIMEILGQIPQFDFLAPYLFPGKFMEWTNFLKSPVEWTPVIKALINFAVWIVGTTGIACWRFSRKDILS